MQIVIPMSGIGERFLKYGIDTPKPLIEVDGKPIIHHVIEMFPGESNFIFICNKEHLSNKNYNMRKVIKSKVPNAKIIGIKFHKLGPVFAVNKIKDLINNKFPVIINYCDFTCYWDYKKFKKEIISKKYHGCIPAYKNFHPHSVWSKNYAFIKEENLFLKDIKEKAPFTDNRMKEFASSGTYYFKTGSLMKRSLKYCLDKDLNTNGEYYISMAFKYLIENNKKVFIHELEHFMQWGTPEDLTEYLMWSNIFSEYAKKKRKKSKLNNHAIIMPLAGLGQRFYEEGYHRPKPLIKAKGKPMFQVAIDDLPDASIYVFVLRKNMKNIDDLVKAIRSSYPNSIIKLLPRETNGQAISCLEGVKSLEKKYPNFNGPITFASCDTGFVYKNFKFNKWLLEKKTDILVWGAKSHSTAILFPNMFGWINSLNKNIKSVHVKTPYKNPKKDPVITGTFTYKNKDIFKNSVQSLIERNEKTNGEFYLDSAINDAINLGYNCELFLVEKHISWGTPNDLKTFNYWESCFRKWSSHIFNGF